MEARNGVERGIARVHRFEVADALLSQPSARHPERFGIPIDAEQLGALRAQGFRVAAVAKRRVDGALRASSRCQDRIQKDRLVIHWSPVTGYWSRKTPSGTPNGAERG